AKRARKRGIETDDESGARSGIVRRELVLVDVIGGGKMMGPQILEDRQVVGCRREHCRLTWRCYDATFDVRNGRRQVDRVDQRRIVNDDACNLASILDNQRQWIANGSLRKVELVESEGRSLGRAILQIDTSLRAVDEPLKREIEVILFGGPAVDHFELGDWRDRGEGLAGTPQEPFGP